MQVKTKETNELWTFVPPAVLPGIPGLYPAARQRLLDGTPAIKEVVATDDPGGATYKFKLERSLDQARGGLGKWRTVLVQSFGTQHPGYFAIDVKDESAIAVLASKPGYEIPAARIGITGSAPSRTLSLTFGSRDAQGNYVDGYYAPSSRAETKLVGSNLTLSVKVFDQVANKVVTKSASFGNCVTQ
jgi:hypothetical protein